MSGELEGANVLITGGTGSLGQTLVRRLLLGARLGTGRGHLRLFVPAEERAGTDEIVDCPEPT